MRVRAQASKAFFSEEKKQKTFVSLSRFSSETHAIGTKVFWAFFSKKNFFLLRNKQDVLIS
jgi:hypothetical protein